jgi:hypothetical protein
MANTIIFSLTADATSPVSSITQSWNITDADLQSLLNWAADAFAPFITATFNPANTPNFTPTNQQILQAWIGSLLTSTIAAVQRFETKPVVAPTPIAVTPVA